MKSSVCIEMIFTEYPFLERIEKAAEAGFDAVEFWNWDNKDLPAIKAAVDRAGLGIGTGELNYANIFKALREAGYDRYVGFEFEPTVPSEEEAAAASLALLRG